MLKLNSSRAGGILAAAVIFAATTVFGQATPPRQMENLGRGVIAMNQGGGKVFVSWRVLGTDAETLGFNLYRQEEGAAPVKLNAAPIMGATNYVDSGVTLAKTTSYFVRPVVNGTEQEASKPSVLAANAPVRDYIEVPLQTPERYTPNDCSVGDLDGDGEYEVVVHMTGQARDNSQAGVTDPPIIQAYKMDGKLLWTINLGRNIRDGAHYTQFMVYDLDGDGIAEIAMKTADGTTDGKGEVIGDKNANWVASSGHIQDGPEFFTIFSGKDGANLATVPYIPGRGEGNSWGGIGGNGGNDGGTNRRERYLATVAYLDGVRPSVVMCRGYYGRSVLAAWDWRDGKLTSRWVFDSAQNENQGNPYISNNATVSREVGLNKVTDNTEAAWRGATPGCFLCWDSEGIKEYRKILAINGKTITVDGDLTPAVSKVAFTTNYSGMGAHWTTAADVTNDGKDDIIYHSMVVNSDGKGLFSTGLRHGDALHIGRFDPDREGIQIFGVHENEGSVWDPWTPAAALFDGATGKVIWRFGDDGDAGRGVCMDIDPRTPGAEFWWSGSGGLYDVKGNKIGGAAPSATNFAIWWDGDDLREILDSNRVMKWNWEQGQVTNLLVAQGCASNNGSKSTPGLSADLFGDWREEVIFRTTANNALRIYSTTIPTQRRLFTLMHDPAYRNSIAAQNVGYNQPPHVGFYLGNGMKDPPKPNIVLVKKP